MKMGKKNTLTKILAVVGTVLVWLPILAPVAITAIRGRVWSFDFLMPAEYFPVTLGGSGLLLWAAWRAGARRRVIGWGLATAVVFLVGGQALALVTGLASGDTLLGGWQWGLVLASIAVYSLALVAVGTGGMLLVRDLFGSHGTATGTS